MNTRLSRVEETLRRALADLVVRGELRDPRLRNAAAISITAVKISPDLGQAQVYVDVLGGADVAIDDVLAGLNAGASALRAKLGGRIRLKRTPALRFVVDRSIEQGRRIEAVLAELHASDAATKAAPDASEPDPDASEPDPDAGEAGEGHDDEAALDDDDEPTEPRPMPRP